MQIRPDNALALDVLWLSTRPVVSLGYIARNTLAPVCWTLEGSPSMAALRDYVQWLDRYNDPDSPLSWRLRKVQQWLRDDLDSRPGPVDLISVCAGDGRDIIDVLQARDDANRVNVVLLEAHPVVADLARQRARDAGLDQV